MRKYKLLAPILTAGITATALLPVVSCGKPKQPEIQYVKDVGEHFKYITSEEPAIFEFELIDNLKEGQRLFAVLNIYDQSYTVDTYAGIPTVNGKNVTVPIYMDGAYSNKDFAQFSIAIMCVDENGVVWLNYFADYGISYNPTQTEIAAQLLSTTLDEFFEYSSHPHPSLALTEIQNYLTNKILSLGLYPMRDNYGNMWFDVPATEGCRYYPPLILQAHMDMVVAGMTEEKAKTQGIKLEYDLDDDNRLIIHSEDYDTSIGADDGIGVAMIFALIENPNISHGPLRVLLTADEEKGLLGVQHLSSAALEGFDYLLNLDAEGNAKNEQLVLTACDGVASYGYKSTFKTQAVTLLNQYKLTVSGFKGGSFLDDDQKYDETGAHLSGSADRYLLEILNTLQAFGPTFELVSFTHDDSEPTAGSTYTKTATIIFTSSASEQEINDAIAAVKDVWKTKYNNENWTDGVTEKLETTTGLTTGLSYSDSSALIQMFGDTLPFSISGWEGETEQEKIQLNNPKASYAATLTLIDGQLTAKSICRMTEETVWEEYKANVATSWKTISDVCQSSEFTVIKDYNPWCPDESTAGMINLAMKGYKHFGYTPIQEHTRGGVEPAYFSKINPELQMVCIGPRMDDIHTTKETLYVDTLAPTLACCVYIMSNIWNV